MQYEHFVVVFIIVIISSLGSCAVGWSKGYGHLQEIKAEHITPCEAELPRNLHCEMVYSARVVEAE